MKLKASTLALAAVACLSMAQVAQAGILTDMTQMFMSNSTAPTTLSTQDRVGAFGGSIHVRMPVANVNLITFDPPRFDAGCGGIDLSMGGFSFINSQQLVAVFRAVAANAVGLAFKAAIDAISPSLGRLIQDFQTLLQKMNNLSKNTCQMAKMAVSGVEQVLGDATGGSSPIAASLGGVFNGPFQALDGYVSSANTYLNKVASYTPKTGNTNAKAIQASGATAILAAQFANSDGTSDNSSSPNSTNNRLLMSFMGYEVTGVGCQNTNAAGAPDTASSAPNSMAPVTCTGGATVTLKDLIEGGGTGSLSPNQALQIYWCVNPSGDDTQGGPDPQICTQMQVQSFNYLGIQGYINTMLFGQADPSAGVTAGSILGQFNSGSGNVQLSSAQYQFIHQTNVPLIVLFSKTSDPNTRISMAQMLSDHITACLAEQVGASIFKAAVATQNGGENNLSADTKKNLSALRKDYLDQGRICTTDDKVLKVVQGINASIRLTSTGSR
jgi:conjugative transfer pilus assembly protein TraH